MANEKRLIDANEMKNNIMEAMMRQFEKNGDQMALRIAEMMWHFIDVTDTVDAVEVVQFNALKSLVNGEWVDCKLVQEALGIDFATGLKMFDFSRTAEWNPAPLNGQKITTKFRLKNAEVHGRWKYGTRAAVCSECGFERNLDDNFGAAIACPNCGVKMDGDGNDI